MDNINYEKLTKEISIQQDAKHRKMQEEHEAHIRAQKEAKDNRIRLAFVIFGIPTLIYMFGDAMCTSSPERVERILREQFFSKNAAITLQGELGPHAKCAKDEEGVDFTVKTAEGIKYKTAKGVYCQKESNGGTTLRVVK
jgi:hypothetical protein